ncbi:uncharacterized protein BT62DRAFT_897249, partial [Guyanagaster necrorhizus]
ILMNTKYHYMQFSVSPKISNVLSVHQAIQSTLIQVFGVADRSIYLDILWVAEEGNETVI